MDTLLSESSVFNAKTSHCVSFLIKSKSHESARGWIFDETWTTASNHQPKQQLVFVIPRRFPLVCGAGER